MHSELSKQSYATHTAARAQGRATEARGPLECQPGPLPPEGGGPGGPEQGAAGRPLGHGAGETHLVAATGTTCWLG